MATGTASTAIELDEVKKHYGQVQALKGINMKIHVGETVAFLGPNGAGKTTTISLMLGIRTPSQGRVSIFGNNPRSAQARARVGAMLQESGVPQTLQVREVVELFRRMYPHSLQTQEAIQLADLGAKERARVSSLSGGQRQRLYFALAVIGNPDLLFLDEPTVGMDVESRLIFWESMRKQVKAGKTMVLTTHNLEEADAIVDRVIVINDGQIVAEGTPEHIKECVSGKHIRFHSTTVQEGGLEHIEGVKQIIHTGDAFDIRTDKPDATFARLTQFGLSLAEVEIVNGGLEEAFLAITQGSGKE